MKIKSLNPVELIMRKILYKYLKDKTLQIRDDVICDLNEIIIFVKKINHNKNIGNIIKFRVAMKMLDQVRS